MTASNSANVKQVNDSLLKMPHRPAGNSERIRTRFGNFGIEVLESNATIRVSSLHSTHDGIRINRTFAVVAYPEVIEPAFRMEHEAIINGQSIGVLFKNNGWELEKHHRYFGEIEISPAHFSVTSTHLNSGKVRSAIHVYSLIIKKDNSRFHYASIAEVHHPDFLQLKDLAKIYGSGFDNHQNEKEKISDFLAVVESRIKAL